MDAPLERYVAERQDRGDDVEILAWTEDRRRALLRVGDQCSVAPPSHACSLGRWECSYAHYLTYKDVYDGRFPVRHKGEGEP